MYSIIIFITRGDAFCPLRYCPMAACLCLCEGIRHWLNYVLSLPPGASTQPALLEGLLMRPTQSWAQGYNHEQQMFSTLGLLMH